jgi:hypothetical protein
MYNQLFFFFFFFDANSFILFFLCAISLINVLKIDECRCEESFEATCGGDIGGGSSLLA